MEEFNNIMLHSIISRFINVDDPSRMIIAGSLMIGGLSFFGALLWFSKDGNKKLTTNDRGTVVKESKKENNNPTAQQLKSVNSSSGDGKQQQLLNVFSVKQKPINTGTNGSNINKKKASSDRPFESSYYFAHNKHSTG